MLKSNSCLNGKIKSTKVSKSREDLLKWGFKVHPFHTYFFASYVPILYHFWLTVTDSASNLFEVLFIWKGDCSIQGQDYKVQNASKQFQFQRKVVWKEGTLVIVKKYWLQILNTRYPNHRCCWSFQNSFDKISWTQRFY